MGKAVTSSSSWAGRNRRLDPISISTHESQAGFDSVQGNARLLSSRQPITGGGETAPGNKITIKEGTASFPRSASPNTLPVHVFTWRRDVWLCNRWWSCTCKTKKRAAPLNWWLNWWDVWSLWHHTGTLQCLFTPLTSLCRSFGDHFYAKSIRTYFFKGSQCEWDQMLSDFHEHLPGCFLSASD